MGNKKLIVWGLAVLLLAAVLFLFSWWWLKSRDSYSAVYLETGEIYFGKFQLFPYPSLTDAWILQGDSENRLALNPLSASVWNPKSLRLNPLKIVFWARVPEDSSVVRTIRQGIVATSPVPSSLPPVVSPTPTSESESGAELNP